MSNSAKIIKSVVKKNVGEKPTFGTDPRDPWSTKANINEDAILDKYLLSRGINPQFATKDQKVAHSKTGQYLKWRRDRANQVGEETVEEGITLQHTPTEKRQHALKRAEHMHKEIRVDGHGKKLHSEAVDKRDTITMNIPLLIRMLEYAREDAKTDLSLHKVVEKLIAIRNRGVLTMKEYNFVTGIREHFELTEQDCSCVPKDKKEWEKFAQKRSEIWRRKQVKKIDESLEELEEGLTDMVMGAAKDAGLKAKIAKPAAERKKDTEDMLKKRASDDKASGIKRPLGGLYSKEYHPKANEEVVVEGSAALRFAKALQKAKQERELKDKSREAREKQQTPAPVKEAMDSLAACAQPGDGANTPNDVVPNKMSKSASIIKSIYKKKNIKEELYDHEKEDKSTSGLKKPKIDRGEGKASFGDNKPRAAIIMTGGKTMTGSPRDTIEIDPLMKAKPGGPNDPTTKK